MASYRSPATDPWLGRGCVPAGRLALAWPVVTTYTLRKGSPAKTRTDLVVICVARTPKGDLVACPGGEDVAAAYGGVLLEDAGGVLQRHLPAPELRELRPEGDVAVMERRLQEGHASKVTAGSGAPAPPRPEDPTSSDGLA